MVIHTFVYAVLYALSAIAIYAVGKPISKSLPAKQATDNAASPGTVPGEASL